MRSGGVALDGDCREGGTFAFSAIRLKLAFSKISYCTFNFGYISGTVHAKFSQGQKNLSTNAVKYT